MSPQAVPLPSWLIPLPDPAQQRALDAWAIDERGIPGIELMERAGAGLAQVLSEVAPTGPVAVVCGKGNNGGDGYVVARLLRERGREVTVIALAPGEELKGDARINYDRLPGPPPIPFDPQALTSAETIVDAILGTGFSGAPHGVAAEAIEAINSIHAQGAGVVACDIPSGVDGATGETAG
ncbi:MAG: NAD(P)H-hydrate epimerase, partial [Solirubrobacteraceae bacterium]